VTIACPSMLPIEVEMVELPGATPVANPELLIVTTSVVLETHLAVAVQSDLAPIENSQVAVYCHASPVPN